MLGYSNKQIFSWRICSIKLIWVWLNWSWLDLLTSLGISSLPVDLGRPQMGRLGCFASLSSSSWDHGQGVSFSWRWQRQEQAEKHRYVLEPLPWSHWLNHHSKVTKQVQEADAKTAKMRLNMLGFCYGKRLWKRMGERAWKHWNSHGSQCRSDPAEWEREGKWVDVS